MCHPMPLSAACRQRSSNTALDVGLVALIAESGLLGAIAYLGLLGFLLIIAFIKKRPQKERQLDFHWLTIFMVALYILLNYLAAFLFAHVVWMFIGLFYAYKGLDEKERLSASKALNNEN